MNLSRLIINNLRFYRRRHLAVVLGVAVSTAILVGALVVGDSLRYSLKRIALTRLNGVEWAIAGQNRFFRAKLADNLNQEIKAPTAAVLELAGIIENSAADTRVSDIHVLGIDDKFGWGKNHIPAGTAGVVLNEALARKLKVRPGDEIILRVSKPTLLSREAPLASEADLTTAARLIVREIARASEGGDFCLQANQIAPFNAFISLKWLQEKTQLTGQANMLLAAAAQGDNLNDETLKTALTKVWQLADASLEVRQLPDKKILELRSDRIFLDDDQAQAARAASPKAVGILSYFANELRVKGHAAPYSIVTAIEKTPDNPLIPADLKDDEIVLNEWLAADLEAQVGDELEMRYFVILPMRKLEERESRFRIRKIMPMQLAMDQELMPNYPGLKDVENCRDWQPGIPIDLDKIRPKDEQYWDQYRGSPKAFITLAAGQKLWRNRFGSLTAVRWPMTESPENLARQIRQRLEPAACGLYFQPVRQRALAAVSQAMGFGELFLGLSFFLIAAAVLLMSLLFVFGIDQRRQEVGLLLAVGFAPGKIKRLLLLEGVVLTIIGSAIGCAGGLLYTRVMIYGLSSLWKSAVAGSAIYFHATAATLFIGVLAGILIAAAAMWLTLRHQASAQVRQLLTDGGFQKIALGGNDKRKSKFSALTAIVSLAAAIATLVWAAGHKDSAAAAGSFFAAGALMLIGTLAACFLVITAGGRKSEKYQMSLVTLAIRSTSRRLARSLAVVATLACGIFLVIAVGANKQSPMKDITQRSSGTGGFALYGKSTVALVRDLNEEKVRRDFGLDDSICHGVAFVSLRRHEGEDASCLNLNRAQNPVILGVAPQALAERGAFTFVQTIDETCTNPWDLLNRKVDDVIPAVADQATIVWALGKSIGQTLAYNDEQGRSFKVRLVGALKNSIMQGSLIIAEDEFVRRFPSEEGYRVFLVDAPQERTAAVAQVLSSGLRDYGLELTATNERLAAFLAVENAYLSIFAVLGGLALMLGSAAVAIVLLRNALERRGDLAMLQAIGFTNDKIVTMIFWEHWGLLLLGVLCGAISAVAAVLPVFLTPAAQIPYAAVGLTVAVVLASGIIAIRLAAAVALKGRMLPILQNE